MMDKFVRLFKVCADLAIEAIKQRDRQKFVESGRYNAQMKARTLMIVM